VTGREARSSGVPFLSRVTTDSSDEETSQKARRKCLGQFHHREMKNVDRDMFHLM
jgi:hypothetical protein